MASDMFLNIENNKVKGESKDETHKDTIGVLAWSWGLSQSGTMHEGSGATGGKVNVQDLSITKYVDRSSPELMKACCSGVPYKNAKLILRKSGGKPMEYLTINLENVLVASISTGGSGGEDRLTENLTLNIGKVKVQYQPLKEDGAKDGGLVEMGWDIPKNVAF